MLVVLGEGQDKLCGEADELERLSGASGAMISSP